VIFRRAIVGGIEQYLDHFRARAESSGEGQRPAVSRAKRSAARGPCVPRAMGGLTAITIERRVMSALYQESRSPVQFVDHQDMAAETFR